MIRVVHYAGDEKRSVRELIVWSYRSASSDGEPIAVAWKQGNSMATSVSYHLTGQLSPPGQDSIDVQYRDGELTLDGKTFQVKPAISELGISVDVCTLRESRAGRRTLVAILLPEVQFESENTAEVSGVAVIVTRYLGIGQVPLEGGQQYKVCALSGQATLADVSAV
jgi:hypothetical protein